MPTTPHPVRIRAVTAKLRSCLLALALAMALAGCPLCPDPHMDILEGSREVHPGDVVQLRARYDDWQSGPDHCGAHWQVNQVEGGSAELGTIDSCGRYQAPEVFPEGLTRLEVEASKYLSYDCADCCPYASIVLHPQP